MQITSFIIAAALTFVGASAGNHNARNLKMHKRVVNNAVEKRAASGFNSPTTWYNVETGNEVACGGHRKNSEWLVAVNSADFRGKATCGQSITIKWKGKTQHAVVADECPTCAPHGIDLSRDLFQSFADLGVGELYVDWTIGGGDPEPEPKPEPKPSPTKEDPPPPKKTEEKKTSSSSTPEPTPTSTKKADKSSTSSSAQPTQSVTVPTGSNNVANLLLAVAQLGSVAFAGVSA